MQKYIFLLSFLGLVGCNGSVEGDVFIIKGGGEIAVSPGRTVTFIPAESERAIFSQAAKSAGAVALAGIQTELLGLCPVAKADAKQVLSGLTEEITEIKAKGSIPAAGCENLSATSTRLASEVASTKKSQASELKRLRADLASAISEKEKRVMKLADKLESEQKKLISVTYAPSGRGDGATWTFRNNTDYCIGEESSYMFYFQAQGFSNGIKTASTSDSAFSAIKDEFGFEIEGCYLPAGKSKTNSGYAASTTKSPEIKKAVTEGKLQTYSCNSSYSQKQCVKVDSARWTSSYELLEVKRKDTGGSVVYSVKPVDWKDKALKSGDFRAYDSKIKDAKSALSRAEKRHASNSLLAEADKAASNAAQCQSDQKLLSELEPLTERAEQLTNAVACDGTIPSTELTASLAKLNGELQLDLQIPDIEEPYQAAFLSSFVETITADTVIAVDTNIQGRYSVEAIKPGDYLVMAEYQDNFVQGFWLEEVTVSSGEQVIDLNQNTFINVPLTEYVQQAAACDECLGNDSIKSRSSLVEASEMAIEARERAKKEMQDAIDNLERTLRNLRRG